MRRLMIVFLISVCSCQGAYPDEFVASDAGYILIEETDKDVSLIVDAFNRPSVDLGAGAGVWIGGDPIEDAGTIDAGTIDAGTIDAGTIDAGTIDAGQIDAGTIDAGTIDAGTVDAGTVDAGTVEDSDTEVEPECRRDKDCSVNVEATYCGKDNKCQACNVNSHCGLGCASCGGRLPLCNGQVDEPWAAQCVCTNTSCDNDEICNGTICI